MSGSELDAQSLAIIYSVFGAVALGCGVIGLAQWKFKLRWQAAYLLWMGYLFVVCNTGSYLVDPSRYVPARFWESFLGPLPFSAISVAGAWLTLRQARARVDRAFSRASDDNMVI